MGGAGRPAPRRGRALVSCRTRGGGRRRGVDRANARRIQSNPPIVAEDDVRRVLYRCGQVLSVRHDIFNATSHFSETDYFRFMLVMLSTTYYVRVCSVCSGFSMSRSVLYVLYVLHVLYVLYVSPAGREESRTWPRFYSRRRLAALASVLCCNIVALL